jgi:hypothetical protein
LAVGGFFDAEDVRKPQHLDDTADAVRHMFHPKSSAPRRELCLRANEHSDPCAVDELELGRVEHNVLVRLSNEREELLPELVDGCDIDLVVEREATLWHGWHCWHAGLLRWP